MIRLAATAKALLGFLDAVLRGVGQVMLQNDRYAGLLFLAGVFYNSRLFGMAVLVGTAASTVVALLLEVERSEVRAGLFGFNGALVAIALTFSFRPDALLWAYVVVAASTSTVVMAAMRRALSGRGIGPLTAPFVVTALSFLLAGASFGRLHPTHALPAAALPQAAVVKGVVDLSTVAHGLLDGVAQVFFQGSAVTGALFVVGLLVSSRRACLLALGGSLVGVGVSWLMGAPELEIRAGVFGFNSVLAAIAIGGLQRSWSLALAQYSLLAAMAAAVVFAALSAAFRPLGMPALTLPFVLVVWAFALAARESPRLRRDVP